MTYTKKQFLEDVAKEARAIKKHATKDELEMLNFGSLNPERETSCVYGQMTGHCASKRAHELIYQCCVRLVDNEHWHCRDRRTIYKAVNGAPESVESLSQKRGAYSLSYVSLLEAYIQTGSAKNKNLIAFLKGERKDLVL